MYSVYKMHFLGNQQFVFFSFLIKENIFFISFVAQHNIYFLFQKKSQYELNQKKLIDRKWKNILSSIVDSLIKKWNT